jgi:hypothetical protein
MRKSLGIFIFYFFWNKFLIIFLKNFLKIFFEIFFCEIFFAKIFHENAERSVAFAEFLQFTIGKCGAKFKILKCSKQSQSPFSQQSTLEPQLNNIHFVVHILLSDLLTQKCVQKRFLIETTFVVKTCSNCTTFL